MMIVFDFLLIAKKVTQKIHLSSTFSAIDKVMFTYDKIFPMAIFITGNLYFSRPFTSPPTLLRNVVITMYDGRWVLDLSG